MATTTFRTVTCQLGHDVPVEAVETVELALDALRYDLDVCEVHAEEVRDVVEEFVAQFAEAQEGPGRYAEVFSSHPWLPKRILALRAFAESSLYRHHIGLTGGNSMTEVDEAVHAIIKVVG